MSKKEADDHKRARDTLGRGLDIGSAHGVYDTPNVRERVRKWQANGGGVVVSGEPIELPPPISPATPSPAAGRRGSQPVGSSRPREASVTTRVSSQAREVEETPLSPPTRVVGKDDWDSASEAEKEEARLKARNKERERKLKRRRDRENGKGSGSVPGTPDAGTDVDSAPGGTPLKEEAATEKSFLGDDGIRVAPLRPKRRGSGSKRKKRDKEKGKEKEEPESPQETKEDAKPSKTDLKSETESINSEARRRVWANDDGIRIYTSKPSTPVRSEASYRDRVPSVRKSERSVKSRKEQFEAEMKRERAAQKDFEEMIRKRDEEDKQSEEKARREEERRQEERREEKRRQRQIEKAQKEKAEKEKAEKERAEKERAEKEKAAKERAEKEKEKEKAEMEKAAKEKAKEVKSSKVGDTESVRKKWQELDDGIRVSPIKEDFDDGIRVKNH
jgi:hypothetical protein